MTEDNVKKIYQHLGEYRKKFGDRDRDCSDHYSFLGAREDWPRENLWEQCQQVYIEANKKPSEQNEHVKTIAGAIRPGFRSDAEKQCFDSLSKKWRKSSGREDRERRAQEDRERRAQEDRERRAQEDRERRAQEDRERRRFRNWRNLGVIAAALLGIWALRSCIPGDQASAPFIADDHSCAQENMTPVQAGSSTAGRLERPNDEDCFALDVPTISTMTLETSGSTDTVGVLRGNGVEAEDDDDGAGDNFRISRRVSPGTYSLVVTGYLGETGDYTLTVQVTPEKAERQPAPVVLDRPTPPRPSPTPDRPPIPRHSARPISEPSGAETLLAEAEGGSARAQLQLGLLHAAGDGVARSYPEALRWLQRAASASEPDGAMHLALMYAAGEGVPQDQSRALYWFTEYLRGNRVAIREDDPSEALDALTAQLDGAYQDLYRQYLRRFVVRSFAPGNRDLRWRSSIPRDDYRRRSVDALGTFRKEALAIRDEFAFNMPPALRAALEVGAVIQRDRSPAIRQNVAAALVDRAQRAFQSRARSADARYQAAVQEAEHQAVAVAALFAQHPSEHAGALKMNVRQKDALVFVDDERYGTVDDMNDGQGRLIPIGPRRIRVELAGHETHEETLVIGAGERYEITGSLRRR